MCDNKPRHGAYREPGPLESWRRGRTFGRVLWLLAASSEEMALGSNCLEIHGFFFLLRKDNHSGHSPKRIKSSLVRA